MGLVINRTPIDGRLEKDDAFFDFFVDYFTKKNDERLRKMIEEEHKLIMDDPFTCRAAMYDKEFVDEAYKEYQKRNA